MLYQFERNLGHKPSSYVGVIVTSGLRDLTPQQFRLRDGIRLGKQVSGITGVIPERYGLLAEAIWQFATTAQCALSGVAVGTLHCGKHELTTASYVGTTLMLGAFPDGPESAEFILFTHCIGTRASFSQDAVFVWM